MKDKDKSGNFRLEDVELNKEPLPIVDNDAYEEYIRLNKHPILTRTKKMTMSDGKEYSIAALYNFLDKNTKHLPTAERNTLLKANKLYFATNAKRLSAMRKAFGKVVQIDKESGVITSVKVTNELDKQAEQLIDLFGRMYSIKEVHEICLTKLKLKCSTEQLKSFRTKYQQEIARKTESFKRDYSDMRLGIKRGRLEELCDLYNQRKRIYELTKKADDHRLLMATLEQIRKEAEGDSIRLEGNLNISVDQIINQQIEQENLATMNVAEIVLARIAMKSGIPVSMFLAQVEKSWYHNAVFSKDNAEDVDFEEIKHPAQQTYDFSAIAKIQHLEEENKPNMIEKAKQAVALPEVQKKVVLKLKSALKEKIDEMRGDVNSVKHDIKDRITD